MNTYILVTKGRLSRELKSQARDKAHASKTTQG